MAFCSKCGTELTEGAKFCPKCGNSVQPTEEKPKNIVDAFKEGWQQGANESQNEPSENESLSTWEKIALGVAGFVSFTGICGGVANGMWIVVLVSLCALGAICAVFMGIIEKKYAWTTAIVSFLVVSGAIGASTDDKEEKQKQVQTEQKQVQTEQKKESPAEKKESNPYAKFAGKYVLYDDEGGKGQRFIVASDGRFLQDNSFDESDFIVSGGIVPKNDKQFEVSLSNKIFGIKEVWSYKDGKTCVQRWDISYNNTLLFDLNENRMYIDIKQYNNRDYTKPEYYKFRFTKQ